jgi:glycosyltransferase involved in cell wall biosynthesis
MIEGRDIVCLSFVTWDDHWGTPQQLMSRLAPRNRIFFVDQPISPASYFTGIRRRDAVAQQFSRWRQGPREVAPNVWAGASPPVLPLRYNKLPNALNAVALRRWLRRSVRRLGFQDPILWNFQPSMPGFGRAVAPSLTVYHCVDEFAAVPQWWHPSHNVGLREAECVREADVVFCTGRTLVERRRAWNANTHFVANAGDYDLFSRAALAETPVAADIAALPGKVVGVLAVLDARLDVDLIVHMARQRPDRSFALVGMVKGDVDVRPLQALPNVHLLGMRPMDELPGYVKGMDVCLIPYVVSDYTRHMFPLKLYEYLAAGKPIVSSDLEEMRPYEGLALEIARSRDEFVTLAERAIRDDSPERAAARQRLARDNSWDHRVEELSAIVGPLLEERTPGRTAARVPTRPARPAGTEQVR